MGWENHNGRAYYYRKERHGERVVSEYIGRAEWVGFIADLEAARREERESQRAAERAEIAQLEAEDAQADGICEMVDMLTRCALIAEGFHQHKRTWRKKRDGKAAETARRQE